MSEKLYGIIFYDAKEHTYMKVDHNLHQAKAEQEIARHRKEGHPAFYIEQGNAHAKDAAEDCASCDQIVRKITRQAQNASLPALTQTGITP